MPIPFSLSTAVSHTTPLTGEAVKRFHGQPSLLSTASDLVQEALGRLQPPISTSPMDLALAWPADLSGPQGDEYMVLPELLIDTFVSQQGLTLVPAYQRLVQRSGDNWVDVPVNLYQLTQELDAVRPMLVDTFEAALALFWSEADNQGVTHWKWMGNYLCRAFERALDVARLLGRIPPEVYFAGAAVAAWRDQTTLAQNISGAQVRPYLVQLQQGNVALPFDTRLDPQVLVSIALGTQPECFMLFSLNKGLRYFPGVQDVVEAIADAVGKGEDLGTLQIQRLRVQGDLFEALARTLLQVQLIQVDALAEWIHGARGVKPRERLKAALDSVTGFFRIDSSIQEQNARHLQQALPDWLRQAPAMDRWHFAQGLAQVAATHPQGAGNWFLEGIPTLEHYAYTRLTEAAAKRHPEGPALVPEHIVATHQYVTQDLISIAGGPLQPQFQEDPVSVLDLCLDNLQLYGGGWLKITPKLGTSLPAWLTGDELKALVQDIDVGEHYPRLLRTRLIEGEDAPGREKLFCEQVALQLPLHAWELMMRSQCGFDRHGYRLVEEGMDGGLEPASVKLVGIGVTAGEAYGINTIAATYVFIRDGAPSGHCVLYRPLHAEPLRQFCSLAALWDDLAAPGELQDEALRWMTDLGRARFSNGGFREPRVARFGQGDEYAPSPVPEAASLALVPLAAPGLHSLYRQVVEALITCAEQRSVSNSENRWLSLGTLSKTLFMGLLPVLSGPLATAGWLIQLSDAFSTYLETRSESDTALDAARTNLLFTIVMLLLSEAVHWPIYEPDLAGEGEVGDTVPPGDGSEGGLPAPGLPSPTKPAKAELPPSLVWAERIMLEAEALPRPQDFQLGWTASDLTLTPAQAHTLVTLRAHPPLEPLSPVPHGPNRGLYLDNLTWLMRWQDHFYAVDFEDGEPRIIGPDGQIGPYVRRDEAGRWAIDLRLRLRGGAPKKRIEARRRQNELDRQQGENLYGEILAALEALRERANTLAEVIDEAANAGGARIEDRERLDQILREGYDHCARLVDLYEALHKQTPLPEFADRLCRILARQLHVTKAMTDNLSEMARLYIQGTPYLGISEKALREVVQADIGQWQRFLECYQDVTQRTATYVQAHGRTVARLNMFPGLGAKVLEKNSAVVGTLQSVLELWATQAYCEMSLVLEPLRDSPVLAQQIHTALEPLLVHGTSHADLIDKASVDTEQALRVLDTASQHYQRVEDAVRVLKQTLPVDKTTAALGRLERIAVSLREDAEQRMTALLSEGDVATPVVASGAGATKPRPAGKPKPVGKPKPARGSTTAPGPGKEGAEATTERANASEVILTDEGDSVLAHIRADGEDQGKLAEVVSNGQVLATWRHDPATGVWSKPARSKERPGRVEGYRLHTLLKEADRALEQVRKEVDQAARFKQATRVPVDIEDQYHGAAQRLETLAEGIEEALTRLNETDAQTSSKGSAERKAKALRDLATNARQLGTQARIELSLSALPTASRVQFLLEAGEVSIVKLNGRTPLGRGGRRDFVQEYEIRDRQRRPLWYAHFHYDTATAAPEQFTAAHLKTLSQRFDGVEAQLMQSLNRQHVITIYRSRIDNDTAWRLFLSRL
jgi:hypothetical protein